MAKEPGYFTFIKNDGTSTSTSVTAKYDTITAPSISNIAGVDWTRSNYNFVEWNTDSNGTGASCSPGDTIDWDTYGVCYAIWEEKHEVTIYYKGSTIASMDASGTKTLETEGTYCEDDIVVAYNKPSATLQSKTVSPTTSQQTISADSGYDGLSSVIVNAMPVGSTTIQNQYYSPDISIYLDDETGEIQSSGYGTYTITPLVAPGYISSGTSGRITVSVWNSYQLPIYEGEHHQPPILTVSLTNPSNPNYFDSCEIYDETSGETKIGEITSADGSVSLDLTDRFGWWDVDTLHIMVLFSYKSGGFVNLNAFGTVISCDGDVSTDGISTVSAEFLVTGAGTIVIDGIDYNWGA